ncbi:MAG: DUF1592 domain-containing protein [Gammaproteobacteria bacterium]|nr:DUF1592 domain-containing protein [Gammaproteobacteria bacterium]
MSQDVRRCQIRWRDKCLLLGLLLSMLILALPANAATGADSTPNFAHPVLTIPRIDVQGYGSLNLSLVLESEASMTFRIGSATPAAAGLNPGATYSLQTQELTIPTLRVGSQFYSAQLRFISADRLQLISTAAVVLPGQTSYQQLCASCHGTDGLGGSVGVSLKNCSNCSALDVLGTRINNTMPLGNPSACVGTCASDIASYILAAFNASSSQQTGLALAAIESLPLDATLRNAALHLVGRLPTAAEMALVTQKSEAGLRQALDGMLEEDAFYARLAEIFNDVLHTNRYLSTNGAEAAIGLMRRYTTARWYDPGAELRGSDYTVNRATTNNSVATEPLELIEYVVRNNKPMTEILTANYFMVNGYSAKSYGITGVNFTNEWDPNEFRPAVLPGTPHAGILSSLMFLNRYPTSATNRNRGRSRLVYDVFLDVDILALDGVRPDGSAVDISNDAPTMENPDCVKCHSLLDPVASSFQNWNLRGTYAPPRTWYTDMFQAGFAGVSAPPRSSGDSLQWLTKQIVADPRFDDAMVRIMYTGLTGHEPLDAPAAGAPQAETEAYLAESTHLDEIKAIYVGANRNLKTLVKEIIVSPYWRADGLNNVAFSAVHEETGAARLLTPELLHRKIEALFGFQWRGPLDQYAANRNVFGSARLLDTRQYYHQIYGGIDSFTITERLTDTNGLMVIVQERMANEMACYGVPNDFLSARTARRLFPNVDTSTVLTSAQGQAAVRQNIQHLHRYLLGEELALTDAEIEHTYALFATVLQQGQSALLGVQGVSENTSLPTRCMRNNDINTGASLNVAGGVDGRLRNDNNYVIRAWMAVVAYLLADYQFIYG